MKTCPLCRRPFHQAKRTCASCGKPIKLRHRWHIDGSHVRHDDCSNPEMVQEKQSYELLDGQE